MVFIPGPGFARAGSEESYLYCIPIPYNRGAQILVARSPCRLKFVRCGLVFVGPQCGTCFISPVWRLESLSWRLDFWKICVS